MVISIYLLWFINQLITGAAHHFSRCRPSVPPQSVENLCFPGGVYTIETLIWCFPIFPEHGGYPMAGWFKHRWFGGTTILGNLHIFKVLCYKTTTWLCGFCSPAFQISLSLQKVNRQTPELNGRSDYRTKIIRASGCPKMVDPQNHGFRYEKLLYNLDNLGR